MSDFETSALTISPPSKDGIGVIAITTSASTAQDTGVAANTRRYVTFVSDVACFITFSNDGLNTSITDPDGTSVAGSSRTWRLPADSPQNFAIGLMSRYFKARGSAAGYLRWYTSSP